CQAEDGIRSRNVTGVQTCALPICCKSPLTGGIKEANGGGTFGYGMGQLRIAGFTLHGASPDWVVLHFRKDGSLDFDDARPYLGKGNFEANRMLLARYGKKVATALCGPVGEY